MNYLDIYNKLINRAKDRILPLLYLEEHHIIPKCLGGSNNPSNLVELTPEEHYVAHQLLVKLYPNKHGLIKAANMMCVASSTHPGKRNNKLYGWLRRRLSITLKNSQTGSGNSQYGTIWIHNTLTQETIKIKIENFSNFEKNGWARGRLKKEKILKKCIICNKDSGRRKTCSDLCFGKSVAQPSIFTGRESEFLELYKKYNSMNRALKEMGFPGAISCYYNWAKTLI